MTEEEFNERNKLLVKIEGLFKALHYPVKFQWNSIEIVEIIPKEGHIETVFVGSGYDLIDITDTIVHGVWTVWADLQEWKRRQDPNYEEDEPIPY